MNDTVEPRTMLGSIFLNAQPLKLGGHSPQHKSLQAHFYTDPPSTVTLLHVHRDAVVTSLGDVFTRSCKLVLQGCSCDTSVCVQHHVDSVTGRLTIPVYDEVFVVSQYGEQASSIERSKSSRELASTRVSFTQTRKFGSSPPSPMPGVCLAELLIITGL